MFVTCIDIAEKSGSDTTKLSRISTIQRNIFFYLKLIKKLFNF